MSEILKQNNEAIKGLVRLQCEVTELAIAKGRKTSEDDIRAEVASLVVKVGYLSELAINGRLEEPSVRIPDYCNMEEALADILLEILTIAGTTNCSVVSTAFVKHEFNKRN